MGPVHQHEAVHAFGVGRRHLERALKALAKKNARLRTIGFRRGCGRERTSGGSLFIIADAINRAVAPGGQVQTTVRAYSDIQWIVKAIRKNGEARYIVTAWRVGKLNAIKFTTVIRHNKGIVFITRRKLAALIKRDPIRGGVGGKECDWCARPTPNRRNAKITWEAIIASCDNIVKFIIWRYGEGIRPVIRGEEITCRIEREGIRVSYSFCKYTQITAIRIGREDRAGVLVSLW